MKQEWFAAKELIGVAGLPGSTQGIHGMARRQEWIKRRRRGVQGRAVEYHVDSLPIKTVSTLLMQEQSAEYVYSSHQDPLAIWVESYKQFSEDERKSIVSFIVREGVKEMMKRLALNQETTD